ncbi:MAG: hypothetical protein LUG52_06390 [Clostridia bacterium]|nr:hypothetical protein [Clostridia bacterium]
MKKIAVIIAAFAAVFMMGTVSYAESVTLDGETVEVQSGDTIVLPEKDGVAAYVDENLTVYAPGKVVYDGSFTELCSVGLGVTLWDGAQVRIGSGVSEDGKISGTDSGIRFIADVSRTNTLAALDGAEIGIALTADGSSVVQYIPADKYQNESKTLFTAALVNISSDNFNRIYTAYPYVKIDGTYCTGDGVSRSLYQVASGLLSGEEISGDTLWSVLNAYVNETGVRLTFSDVKGEDAFEVSDYTGDSFFEIDSVEYDADEDMYTVVLSPSGQAKFSDYWREAIRINNNHSTAASEAYMRSGELTNGSLRFTFKIPGYTFDQTSGVVIVSEVDTENGTLTGYQSGAWTEFTLADEIEVVGISSDIADVRAGATVMLGFDTENNVAAIELLAAFGGSDNDDDTILTANYGEKEAYASTEYKNIVGRYSALSGRRLTVRFIGDEFENGEEKHTYKFEKSATKYYVVAMTEDGELESVTGYGISLSTSAISAAQKAGSVFFYLRYDDENEVVKEAVLYSFSTTTDYTDGGDYSPIFSYDETVDE